MKTLRNFDKASSLNQTQRSGLLIKSNRFVSIKDHSNPITAKVQTNLGLEQFGIFQYDHNGQQIN